MAFQKGFSGNPKGRPKGVKEAVKRTLADRLAKFLNDDFNSDTEAGFTADWIELSPANRMRTRVQMFEFVIQKLSRQESIIDVSKLTDEEVNNLLERIQAMHED